MRELRNSYTEDFRIKSYENDVRQKLRLTTLFQYLQEVAGRHVTDTPVGYDALEARGQFWVLVRIRARILRMPAWRDTVSVETWAKRMDRMFAYREYEVRKDGELLIAATSEWMLMDRESRKPCRLSCLPAAMPLREEEGLAERIGKLVPAGRGLTSRKCVARYSDIDMYHHVNNTKYIEWAMDCFEYSFLAGHEVEEIQINFVAEVGPDEEVSVSLIGALDENGLADALHYYIEGYNTAKQMKAFQMEVRLR